MEENIQKNMNRLEVEDGKETPESEYSIECFQNYTAPEVFIQGLAGIVDQQDVESMIRAQKQMLQRFEKTNEMLTNCNALSASRLKLVAPEFKKHTQLLLEIKKDLDYIFKKLRAIKTKLNNQHPDAFSEAVRSSLAEECQEDEEIAAAEEARQKEEEGKDQKKNKSEKRRNSKKSVKNDKSSDSGDATIQQPSN